MSDQYAINIVNPVTITESKLVSTNIAENDYPAWSSATAYASGVRVIRTSTHRVYESLQASNTNNAPETSPLWWVEVGPTNRWRVFDSSNLSQTVNVGGSPIAITYTLQPGEAIGCVAILNITGGSNVSITMTDPTYGVVYSQQDTIGNLPPGPDWWNWLFGSRVSLVQYVKTDLPTYPAASIQITVTGDSSLALGVVLVGKNANFSMGMKYGARVGIQDYSRKETNEFGDPVFVERAFAKRASFDVMLENAEIDALQSYLTSIRAKPVLWVASNEYSATVIYGFYKNFDILLNYVNHADCSLEIEGLT